MRICVYGAGAIGGNFAARLADAGNEVSIVARGAHLEAIRANGAPHQRLARAMKVGKEEMLGVLAAVRRYVAIDHAAQQSAWEATVGAPARSTRP